MDILLDGKIITDKKVLFEQLKSQINDEAFYGNNLDALWDVLSYLKSEIRIVITNEASLKAHLGAYAEALLEVFEDLKGVNEFASIDIK